MAILRTQSAIAEASTADLVETYNALTGKSISRFSSRAAGEAQVANALLAATDRAGHLGVPKGARPAPITVSEAAARSRSDDAPPVPVAAPAPAPKTGMRAALAEKASAAPNAPRPKPAQASRAPGAGRAPKVTHVVPTGAGHTRLQPGSTRNAVFVAVREAWEQSGAPVAAADIAARMKLDTVAGYIAKLIEGGHLRAAAPAPEGEAS